MSARRAMNDMRFDSVDVRDVRHRFDAIENRFVALQNFALTRLDLEGWTFDETQALWGEIPMNRVRMIVSVSKFHGVRASASWAAPSRVEAELRVLAESVEKFEQRVRALNGESVFRVLQ